MSNVEISSLSTLDPASQTSNDAAAQLRFFDVPLARNIKGNAFPVGLTLEENTSPSLAEVNTAVSDLAKRGVIRDLLTKREFPGSYVQVTRDNSLLCRRCNLLSRSSNSCSQGLVCVCGVF